MPAQSFMGLWDGRAPAVNANDQVGSLAYTRRCVSKTAAYTVKAEDSGTWFDNVGAGGSVTFTLPDPTTCAGAEFLFTNYVAQNLVVSCSGAIVYDGSIAVGALTSSTSSHQIGAMLLVVSNGTKWLAFAAGNASAVWTAS